MLSVLLLTQTKSSLSNKTSEISSPSSLVFLASDYHLVPLAQLPRSHLKSTLTLTAFCEEDPLSPFSRICPHDSTTATFMRMRKMSFVNFRSSPHTITQSSNLPVTHPPLAECFMTTSNTLKLKLGPFRVATSIFLVNVMPFGHRNATYLLRVERPNVCGGCIDVSIGHPDMPIKLLPRSAKDRRKLRFAIRYGMKKGKTIRFCAPNTTVYDHWIAVLCEAFEGSAKAAKRSSTKTDSAIDHDGYNDIDIQEAVITSDDESMLGHCGSITIDAPGTDYNNSCREHDAVVTDMDTCSSSSSGDISGIHQTPIVRSDALWSVIEKPRGALEQTDVCIEDNTSTDTSTKRQPSLTLASKPVSSTSTDKDDENVYDAATNVCETALSFTRVPLQGACTTDHDPRMDKVYNLSSVEWLHRIIRYLCNGELVSGCFRLTDTSCNRLQPTDVKSVVQSFIIRWLAILQQPLACIGIRLRTCHHDAFCRTCLYLYRRFCC